MAAIFIGGNPMNGEGYPDPTADKAVENADKENRRRKDKHGRKRTPKADKSKETRQHKA